MKPLLETKLTTVGLGCVGPPLVAEFDKHCSFGSFDITREFKGYRRASDQNAKCGLHSIGSHDFNVFEPRQGLKGVNATVIPKWTANQLMSGYRAMSCIGICTMYCAVYTHICSAPDLFTAIFAKRMYTTVLSILTKLRLRWTMPRRLALTRS